jgi:hypothetical protein
MGCMGHGRKKYSKFVTKISILAYSTLESLKIAMKLDDRTLSVFDLPDF